VGFLILDELVQRHRIDFIEKDFYETGRGLIRNVESILLKPLTYMNRSGEAVREFFRFHPLRMDNLIAVHDDMDMITGKVKIKKNGSSGGHKGVQSIIDSMGTNDFARVKVGIGRDPSLPPTVYVLQNFRIDEMETVNEAIKVASDAIEMILLEGIDRAMNRFH